MRNKITFSCAILVSALMLCSCSYDIFFGSSHQHEDNQNNTFSSLPVTEEAEYTEIPEASVTDPTIVLYTEEPETVFPEGYYSDGIYYPEDCGDADEIFRILRSEFRKFSNTAVFSGTIEDDVFSEILKKYTVTSPELYWVTGYSWRSDGSTTEITFKTLSDMSMDEIREKSEAVNQEIFRIISMMDPGWTDYQKVMYIHDYIISNADYDNEGAELILNGTGGLYSSAYGCLIQGKAVCQGYADALKMLLDRAGIECEIVSGVTEEGDHAWNYVKLDDDYYWIDATWDDPSIENSQNSVRYDYFLLNDEIFMKNRTADYPENLPECSSMKYNYFVMNNLFIDTYSFEDINIRLNDELSESGQASFMFSSSEEMERCMSELIDSGRIWETDILSRREGRISYGADYDVNVFTVIAENE